jgi:uncharacterized caspase-like protein
MKRISLSIGINDYPGTGSDLAGCVNDAMAWQKELEDRRFDALPIMLDGDADKASIVSAINDLAVMATAGGLVVITYSGHGTWVRDRNGDEADRRDEGICPHDIARGNVLLDDELAVLMSHFDPDVRVVVISDSCHSGTVVRAVASDCQWTPRFLAKELWMPDGWEAGAVRYAKPKAQWDVFCDRDLLLAGCRDAEYSYDAEFGGMPAGAFSYYALRALRSLRNGATYSDWYKDICRNLPSRDYPQTPQWMGNKGLFRSVVF